jgi:ABC-2 type transport system permease protein
VSRLLQAELIKLRTTRTFYALAGAAIGISLLITVLIAATDETSKDNVLADVFQNDASTLFIMILAIVGITDRIRFLAAKTLAFAAAGALLSLAVSISIGIVGYAILEFRDQPTPALGDLLELFARNAGAAALLGAFGVGVGGLVRNQPTAIVAILVFAFVIDPLLAAFAPGIDRFSPVGALPSAIQGIDPDDVGSPDVDFFAVVPALTLMLAMPTRRGRRPSAPSPPRSGAGPRPRVPA